MTSNIFELKKGGAAVRLLIGCLMLCALAVSMPQVSFAQTTSTTGTGAAAGAATGTATGTGGTVQTMPKPNNYPLNCYVKLSGIDLSGCFGSIVSWIGSWFLTIGGFLLRIAGMLFDLLVTKVIINFAGLLGSGSDGLGIMTAINAGWTVFRDFSNILIIGMFVFIAISIILGLKEYGQKKLIANVLIVAVLINFSLLFTKLIIDFSNFTAYQIYNQMSATGTQLDISQAFLTPMHITSVWNDTGAIVKTFSEQNGVAQGLAFSIVGGLLLFAVAVVLLYGCYLIAARGVLFIFLMITSPLAFATYLIPNLSKSEYGFTNWWKTLFNTAIFAPLLMLFLAISIVIIKQAGNDSTLPLGQLIADPSQLTAAGTAGTGWVAIFVYILGIGLLFLSLKLSSSFASSISGFNIAQAIVASPITQGSRALAPLLRATSGRAALSASKQYTQDAKGARLNAGLALSRASSYQSRADSTTDPKLKAQLQSQADAQHKIASGHTHDAAHAAELAAKKKKEADSTFNAMDSSAAKAVAKAIGLSEAAAGQSSKDTKGYKSQVDDKAKHAAEIADSLKLGEEDKKALRKQAEDEIEAKYAVDMTNRKTARDTADTNLKAAEANKAAMEQAHSAATQLVETTKVARQPEVAAAQNNVNSATAARETMKQAHEADIAPLLAQIKDNRTSAADRKTAADEVTSKQLAHEIELKQQDSRIMRAKESMQSIEKDISAPVTLAKVQLDRANDSLSLAKGVFKKTDEGLNTLTKQMKNEVENRNKELTAYAAKSTEQAAEEIGRSEGSLLNKIPVVGTTLGNVFGQNNDVAEAARGLYNKKQGASARLSQIIKDSDVDTGGGAAPAAPTPPPAH